MPRNNNTKISDTVENLETNTVKFMEDETVEVTTLQDLKGLEKASIPTNLHPNIVAQFKNAGMNNLVENQPDYIIL